MLVKLQERSLSLHRSICQSQLVEHFSLGSDEISPLKHLYLIDKSLLHSEEQIKLKNITNYVSNSFLPHVDYRIKCMSENFLNTYLSPR